jgi:putative transposase
LIWCWLVWMWLKLRHWAGLPASPSFRTLNRKAGASTALARNRPKPAWVPHAILVYRALSPGMSCRHIAETFNRRHAHRHVSVGKTYVGSVLRRHALDLLRLRRSLKCRVPRAMPTNQVWGLDLTGNTGLDGKQSAILGLLDHGSRACLAMTALTDKRSLTILRHLLAAFRSFGLPRVIRVDHEACLTSRLLRLSLALLGVRLQRIERHCPWQNGRVERLFGTLKGLLDPVSVVDRSDLTCKLIEFRLWYNHVRPHQHLAGRTPAEAWDGRNKATGKPLWFSGWDGYLSGWYFPP